MKRLALVVMLVSLSACKGPAGSKGSDGARGSPGTIDHYTGAVTSDSQFILVPTYQRSESVLSVSVGDGVSFVELPYYSPPLGVNVFFLAQDGHLTISNAQSAAATQYLIVVVNPATSAPAAIRP